MKLHLITNPPSLAYNHSGKILLHGDEDHLSSGIVEGNKRVHKHLAELVSSSQQFNSAKFGEVRRSLINIET
jgi:hypothetical protein